MMDEKRCSELLAGRGIRPTSNRILVVKELAAAGRPLSLSEMEHRLLTVDKSGIFRALSLFREHRLVHVIENGDGGVRYELCAAHGGDAADDDTHVHFYCESCHRTFCIDNEPVPQVELPAGYSMRSVNYVVRGLCPECGG